MMGNANLAGLNSPVWFITGCSTGFGRDLARHVLASGYRAVVTARRPDDLKEFADPERALLLKVIVELCCVALPDQRTETLSGRPPG